ncbi:HK97 gp10 family phage protein [Clostridium kluyveri]|uniref:HK97 gp10 family phage protein n=1 Tax=Clostridium kluyveri TaxID=1534 RepID=UPI0022457A87|nr:HK97 gp10 family phage protein [Clostridium kluyveri]UZQ51590.1 HK97 gp10 family phage protein [Clostridium kluyveri]
MARIINVDQLAAGITRMIKEYTDDVSEKIERKVDSVADKVLEEVKATAPKKTGKYAKGFKKTKQGSLGKAKRVIWNSKDYRRVHLLEFGHAKVNGGRVDAIPHLRPAYEKYGAKLPEDIKNIIRSGG